MRREFDSAHNPIFLKREAAGTGSLYVFRLGKPRFWHVFRQRLGLVLLDQRFPALGHAHGRLAGAADEKLALILGEIDVGIGPFKECGGRGLAERDDLESPTMTLDVLGQRNEVAVAGGEHDHVNRIHGTHDVHRDANVPVGLLDAGQVFHERFGFCLNAGFLQSFKERRLVTGFRGDDVGGCANELAVAKAGRHDVAEVNFFPEKIPGAVIKILRVDENGDAPVREIKHRWVEPNVGSQIKRMKSLSANAGDGLFRFEIEISDEFRMSFFIFALDVFEKPAAFVHFFHESAAGGMVFFVVAQVSGQVFDFRSENGDLNLGGSSVVLMRLVLRDDILLLARSEHRVVISSGSPRAGTHSRSKRSPKLMRRD